MVVGFMVVVDVLGLSGTVSVVAFNLESVGGPFGIHTSE